VARWPLVGVAEKQNEFLTRNTKMDTQLTESHELSPAGASAPEAAVDVSAVRSADFGGPLVGSTDETQLPVCSPDLWELAAREGCDWEFSREGLRAVRRVNLGELLALLGAEQQTDEPTGNLTDEVRAKTGVLKAAKKLRLGVWDNMRRRWDAVVDNKTFFTVQLELDHGDEMGFFSVSVPGVVAGYELRLEPAFRKKGGGDSSLLSGDGLVGPSSPEVNEEGGAR